MTSKNHLSTKMAPSMRAALNLSLGRPEADNLIGQAQQARQQWAAPAVSGQAPLARRAALFLGGSAITAGGLAPVALLLRAWQADTPGQGLLGAVAKTLGASGSIGGWFMLALMGYAAVRATKEGLSLQARALESSCDFRADDVLGSTWVARLLLVLAPVALTLFIAGPTEFWHSFVALVAARPSSSAGVRSAVFSALGVATATIYILTSSLASKAKKYEAMTPEQVANWRSAGQSFAVQDEQDDITEPEETNPYFSIVPNLAAIHLWSDDGWGSDD